MEGIALSIDPGRIIGWAIIGVTAEAPALWGEIKADSPELISELSAKMFAADLLIIEDQYLDKNADSLIKIAALRGTIEGLWAAVKNYPLGEQVCRVKPAVWQASLNLSAQATRKSRKRASMIRAKTEAGDTNVSQDAADAICMGLAIVRRLKHKERTTKNE